MEMQGNEHEQEFNDVISEVIETLKQSYDVDVCPESTYSCPMVWWYHRRPTVEKDIKPFVRLFDKTKKAIFDLLADYVNLASIDSSIFSLDHCYSIYDINNCDAMISGYPSFIMSINVLLEECRYIENSLDANELMSGFFRVFKHFLKKNLSFFLGHNHDKYEMNIKTKIGKGQRIICELDNSDCKMEKNYLKCVKKIDNYITNLNEKYNLKSNNLLRESVRGLIKRFEMLVNTKKAILNNKVKRIRTVVYRDGESNKNDNGFNDGDFMKNKLAKDFKDDDASDDDSSIIENQQDFERATKELLDGISEFDLENEKFSHSCRFYYSPYTIKTSSSILDITSTSTIQGESIETSTNIWMFVSAVSIIFIAISSLVGGSFKLYQFVKNRSKKENVQKDTSIEIMEL